MPFHISRSSRAHIRAMGREESLVAFGDHSQDALEEAAARVRAIDTLLSPLRADSEVARINHTAGHGDVQVSADTFFVVKRALQYAEQTSGCLDITIAPVLRLWAQAQGQSAEPAGSTLGRALRLVNYKDVLLGTGSFKVRLNYEGQAIDLGAVARGYAADEVRKVLEHHRICSALMDLGGSAVAIGSGPDGKPWKVPLYCVRGGVARSFGTVEAENCAVATAGDGSLPVIDTKTGRPADSGLRSVTVLAGSAFDAQALAFTALVLGPEQGRRLVQDKGAEAVLVTDRGLVAVTDGLKGRFSPGDPRALTD